MARFGGSEVRTFHDDEDDKVTVLAKATGGTAKALLVLVGTKEVWIPKSVIHDDSEIYNEKHTTEGKLVLKGWWARKEGVG
jgi:hypothetical protein